MWVRVSQHRVVLADSPTYCACGALGPNPSLSNLFSRQKAGILRKERVRAGAAACCIMYHVRVAVPPLAAAAMVLRCRRRSWTRYPMAAAVMRCTQLMQSLLLLSASASSAADWLVTPPTTAVTVKPTTAGGRPAIIMSNGIISRTFITSPNWATWSLKIGEEDMLRSVQPESSFQLDNQTTILVGGVGGAGINFAFKNRSSVLTTLPSSYQYQSHSVVHIAHRYDWTPGSRHSEVVPWPPAGIGLEVTFAPPTTDPLAPAAPCPANCTGTKSSGAGCGPQGVKCCANPGGRFIRGPNPHEIYPYYGKPCRQQSDCGQCTLDGECTCEPIVGQPPPFTGCCKPRAGAVTDVTMSDGHLGTSTLPRIKIIYEM
jgi:hypothetical protein